jgi:hypothetical protein
MFSANKEYFLMMSCHAVMHKFTDRHFKGRSFIDLLSLATMCSVLACFCYFSILKTQSADSSKIVGKLPQNPVDGRAVLTVTAIYSSEYNAYCEH